MSTGVVPIKTIDVQLTRANARYVLHALRELEAKCRAVVDNPESDEDAVFFHANDHMETTAVLQEIEKLAVQEFGEDIKKFSHELL